MNCRVPWHTVTPYVLPFQAEKAKKEAEVAFEECSDAARQEVSWRGVYTESKVYLMLHPVV